MTATFTKVFEFSASHSAGAKVIGRNYALEATFAAPDADTERGLEEKIDRALIQKLHSRDLGQHVDLLKGRPLDELSLLQSFWTVVVEASRPAKLQTLALRRDRRTQWTLKAE